MSTMTAQLVTRGPRAGVSLRGEWLSFLMQIGLVAAVELCDDFGRGLIAQHDSHTGLLNADRVVSFEAAHGFWVEPAWQQFFMQSHHLLGLRIGWSMVAPLVAAMYSLGHVLFTFAFALWIYFCRRGLFRLLRNTFFIANALALVGYELFPMAPPRLTTGLHFNGQPFHFADPLFGVLGADGKLAGTKLGYDEFAAMPSLHVAWALIVGISLALILRAPLARLVGLLYPLLMTVTVVVTGNHYLMDAVGAAFIVALSASLSLLIEWRRGAYTSPSATLRELARLRHRSVTEPAHAPGRTPEAPGMRAAA